MNETLIYTIGHSDHEMAVLLDLLRRHGIQVVVDVRSQPYSRWTPQFNRELLAHALQEAGLTYRFMGDALGGRPSDPAMYDPGQERPNYRRVAESAAYRAGLEQLIALATGARLAILCSEGDHQQCHRNLLITQTLLERGLRVLHIQPDGATTPGELPPRQLTLFE